MAAVPAFKGQTSFNAHHSPMGAFFSFTCGNFGTRGGLAAQAGGPADQNLYIGVKEGDRHSDSPLKCLPFYEGAVPASFEEWDPVTGGQKRRAVGGEGSADAAAAYLVEQAGSGVARKRAVLAYAKEVARHYGWASDVWKTPEFDFGVFTPFGGIPDPAVATAGELRKALLPAVCAELIVDNTGGKTVKTGFFAVQFAQRGVRMIDTGLGGNRVGFAVRNELGVAGELWDVTDGCDKAREPENKPFGFMRWAVADGLAEKDNPVHLLGNTPGIAFEVPPGKKYCLTLALGCYVAGAVTTRLEGAYYYTRYYASLNDVLGAALDAFDGIVGESKARDAELLGSGLSADQQFLLAHATRSYYGSTELLDVAGQPFWIVNEGEYVMINTLDLSIDHAFWEMAYNPWVVKNLLDNFVRFYSYHDQVRKPGSDQWLPGGISFCHDMGVNNQFSPFSRSSYELTNLDGCFSHMTAEQLCNWSLLAACYVAKTGDQAWVRANEPVLRACLESMINRGGESGFTELDSSRCGRGAEITTYDSLDHSLAQTRNNVYMAVKCWATYHGLAMLLGGLDAAAAKRATSAAEKVGKTVAGQLKDGVLPAVFEEGNPGHLSRILPAIEGLVYPLYWGTLEGIKGAEKELLGALRTHTVSLLGDAEGRNRFADGGVKLSSTSANSWMSKIAIVQHVAREVFNLDERGAARKQAGAGGWEKADAAHVKWQTEGDSAYWACSDQMVNGVAKGSKYYPRIVTTVLWM